MYKELSLQMSPVDNLVLYRLFRNKMIVHREDKANNRGIKPHVDIGYNNREH